MGRAAVRQVVTAYFTNANIPFIGTVHPSRPYIITEEDYDLQMSNALFAGVASANSSSGVLVVNIPNSSRVREAMTGRAFVNDFVTHNVALEFFFANTAGDALQAQADHDTACDAITIAVRADPLLANGAVVFSAGEFRSGVHIEQHEPFTGEDGTTVFIPSRAYFDVHEYVIGPAGT